MEYYFEIKSLYKNSKKNLLYYCKECNIIICGACKKWHKNNHSVEKYELNTMCKDHAKKYIQFCKTCNKHLCEECAEKHNYLKEYDKHDRMNLEISVDKNLKFLSEEKEKLIKKKN